MKTITNKGGNTDLRAMLIRAGIGENNAIMSIPYMNFLPTTTEPYAQGVQQIVTGLQNLLIQRGARIDNDGGMGDRTVDALLPYAGPRWYDKSWSQLYGDVIDGRLWQSWDRESRASQKRSIQYWDGKAAARGSMSGLGATRFSSSRQLMGVGHTAYHHLGADSDAIEVGPPPSVIPLFKITSGIAIPHNGGTLTLWKSMQRVINAIIASATTSQPMVEVDGRIGGKTVTGMNWCIAFLGSSVRYTVETLAQNSVTMTESLNAARIKRGADFVADPTLTKPPSELGPNNTVINPPIDQIGEGNGWILPMTALLVGGVLIFLPKKGRR